MTGKRALLLSGAIAFAGVSVVVAQDLKKDKPLVQEQEQTARCEAALRTKEYLKDLKISLKDEGGKICCEGTVPSKVHACAVFLTCMSVDGVNAVDISKLRIADATDVAPGLGSPGVPAGGMKSPVFQGDRPTTNDPLRPGTDVRGGYARGTGSEKSPAERREALDMTTLSGKKLRLIAVVMDPTETGGTLTTPAGARRFQNDVIVIDQAGASLGIGSQVPIPGQPGPLMPPNTEPGAAPGLEGRGADQKLKQGVAPQTNPGADKNLPGTDKNLPGKDKTLPGNDKGLQGTDGGQAPDRTLVNPEDKGKATPGEGGTNEGSKTDPYKNPR